MMKAHAGALVMRMAIRRRAFSNDRNGELGKNRPEREKGHDGRRKGHVLLPAGRRLAGLERGGIYLVRTDEDGFEWVERYGWPAGLR